MIARSKGLAIVDTGNCEQILKDNNILPQSENLYSLNTNIKNSIYNNDNSTQYTLQSVYTSLVDSKGNSVNTSLCSDFTIKLPTGNQLQNQSDYEYFKNSTGVDIYNKSDPFFTDICRSYSKNDSDIVLQSRHELYPKAIVCDAGCVYNGIDEHGYSLCKCTELPKKKMFNAGRDLIFKLLNLANYKLVRCINNIFTVDPLSVTGLFAIIILSFSYLITFYIYSKFLNVSDLSNNKPKVLVNDLLDINILNGKYNSQPPPAGAPMDLVNFQSKQLIPEQMIINDANLVLNNNINRIRASVVEEEGKNNFSSVVFSPLYKNNFKNKNIKILKLRQFSYKMRTSSIER